VRTGEAKRVVLVFPEQASCAPATPYDNTRKSNRSAANGNNKQRTQGLAGCHDHDDATRPPKSSDAYDRVLHEVAQRRHDLEHLGRDLRKGLAAQLLEQQQSIARVATIRVLSA